VLTGHQKLYGQSTETHHTVRCYICSKTFSNEEHTFNSNNTCSKCGQKKVITPCTTHTYQQIEYEAPTCTKKGTKVSQCTKCKVVKTEEYEKTAHIYSNATCTEPKKCRSCGITSGTATGHQYVYEYLSEAYHVKKCTNCGIEGEKSTHTVDNTGTCKICNVSNNCVHEYDTEITPISEYYHHKFCVKCNDYIVEDHTPNIDSPTCTLAKKCKLCGYVIEKATGHDYVYTKISNAMHVVNCKNCQLNSNQKHEFIDNAYNASTCKQCKFVTATCMHTEQSWKTIIRPTCKSAGEEQLICSNCKKILEKNILPAEHDFEWKTTIEPTCTAAGLEEYKCSFCDLDGNKKDKILEPLGHKFNENGYCTTCNFFDTTKAICKFKGDKHKEYETTYKRQTALKHLVTDTCLICKEVFEVSTNHDYEDGMNCACGATKDTSSCSSCGSTKIKETYSTGTTKQNHIVTYVCNSCSKTIATKSEPHTFIEGKCLCNQRRSLTLSTYKVTLMPGESIKVSAVYLGDLKEEISWKSKNTKVATVVDGLIRASENPTSHYVQILASIDGMTRTVEVTVNKNIKANIQLIAPSEAYVGETISLAASLTTSDGTRGNLSWAASGADNKLTPTSTTYGAWLRASEKGKVTIKVVYQYGEGKTVQASKTIKIIEATKIVAKSKIAVVVGTVSDLGGSVLKRISGNSVIILGTSIKAIAPGTTIVEDQEGNRYEIVVMEKDVELISASISLNSVIYLGKTAKLNITTDPPLTTSQYKIVASNHFSVDNNGNVKAIKVGKGSVKVVYKNKTIAKQDVEVKVGDALINVPDSLYVGQSVDMNIFTTPALSPTEYTVTTSNSNIIINGNSITGVKVGKTNISVKVGKTTIGTKTVEIKLAVVNNFHVEDSDLFVNQTTKLAYQVIPEESAKNCQVTVSSNLSYDASSKTITALKEGTGTIKLILDNKTLAETKVTVQYAIATLTASKTAILAGEKINYTLTVEPATTPYEITSNRYIEVDTSSNTITGKELGKGILTVKSGGKEIGKLNITVSNPTILLDAKEASVSSYSKGYKIPVTAVTAPGDSLVFSSNSSIVNVNSSGYITINRDKYVEEYGRKTATVKITISLASGAAQKTFTLKITNYEYKNFYKSAVAIKEGTTEETAPLVIYIGGQGEMANNLSSQASNPSVHYLHSNKSYAATTITVKVDKANEQNMKNAMDNTISYVKELVEKGKIDPSKISVVSYSYGGYGAQYAAQAINELEGYQVNNLVLLDSVQPDYRTKDRPDIEALQEVLNGGTDITVYGSSHTASGQYGVWDACRDAVAYDEAGKFNETNGQFNGKILADPAHNGWTKDQEVLAFLDNLAGVQ